MSQQAKLDELAARASTTRSGPIRRLIDGAAAEADVRIPGERLTESELLDLLHEQARGGRSSAITHLLQRQDSRDSVDRLQEVLSDHDEQVLAVLSLTADRRRLGRVARRVLERDDAVTELLRAARCPGMTGRGGRSAMCAIGGAATCSTRWIWWLSFTSRRCAGW